MFEKIKRIFKQERELPYTSETTRVHKKQHAKAGHVFLIVKVKAKSAIYTSQIQLPFGVSDEQKLEVEKRLVGDLQAKYFI